MEPIHDGSLLIVIIYLHLLSSSSSARDAITPADPLSDNETLISATGSFALGFFNPPKSNNRYIGLWYNEISDHTILWVANRANPLINMTGLLSVTQDGRLTITGQNSTVVWSSPKSTVNLTSPIAQLLDNGNLVIRQEGDASSNYGWQGFNYLTDTLIPGMKLGVDLTTGISRTLVAWSSENDPSPGPWHAFLNIKGNPEVYFYRGSTPIWRTGAWDGTQLSGIPDMSNFKVIEFDYVNNDQEVTYSYIVKNKSIVSRLLLNSTGFLQRALWLRETGQWNFFWKAPKDACDNIGECGPYGLCDSNNSPICSCLQGFNPKNLENWNLRDGLDGCRRRTALDCRNGTDGFVTVRNVKLPQSENCSVHKTFNLEQCRILCLRNCSCTAYASADVSGGGSGCVIWVGDLLDIRDFVGFGQDLYVRLAKADVPVVPPLDQSDKKGNTTIAITTSLVLVALMLACISCCIWRKKKRWRREKESIEDEDIELPLFDLDVLIAATDNFSTENKLGEGGFGPVYKGKLRDGQDIAVKTLSKTSNQGIDEFKNEVLLIAKLQHRNLVRLLACCTQREERMLIYEYMPNKSLDALLFDKAESINLDWRTRYHIIIGIARGLLYLHQDSRFRIIHRDLKASNVLLDGEMNPKISDFGLARIFGDDEATTRTRRVVGTYGYMSPEYAMDGVFSVKSDVFSFGVLALEIISGQRNKGVFLSEPQANLLGKVWNLWNEGKGMELIDPSIGFDFSYDEVMKCIKVGLLCVQENPDNRPTMSSVVLMLRDEKDASFCEPQQPGFTGRRDLCHPHSSSTNRDSTSINDISLSIQLGR